MREATRPVPRIGLSLLLGSLCWGASCEAGSSRPLSGEPASEAQQTAPLSGPVATPDGKGAATRDDGPPSDGPSQHIDEVSDILQAVVDAPQLEAYYHIEAFPERVPLCVVKNEWVPAMLRVSKFGRPVELVGPDEAPDAQHCLVVDRLAVGQVRATLTFRYPPEGLRGEATLVKKGSARWHLTALKLTET